MFPGSTISKRRGQFRAVQLLGFGGSVSVPSSERRHGGGKCSLALGIPMSVDHNSSHGRTVVAAREEDADKSRSARMCG